MEKFFALIAPWFAYANSFLAPLYKKCNEFLAIDGIFLPEYLKTPVHFFGALLLTFVGGVYFMHDALIYLVGVIYPMLFTLSNYETNTNWTPLVKYWVVYNFMAIIENSFAIIFQMIPLFYFIKLAFVIYLVRNSFRGAESLFSLVVSYYKVTISNPFIKKHIDRFRPIQKELNKVSALVDPLTSEKKSD